MAQEYLSGEASLHGLAKRHDISRNLIRIWIERDEAGAFDDDQVLAGTLEAYKPTSPRSRWGLVSDTAGCTG